MQHPQMQHSATSAVTATALYTNSAAVAAAAYFRAPHLTAAAPVAPVAATVTPPLNGSPGLQHHHHHHHHHHDHQHRLHHRPPLRSAPTVNHQGPYPNGTNGPRQSPAPVYQQQQPQHHQQHQQHPQQQAHQHQPQHTANLGGGNTILVNNSSSSSSTSPLSNIIQGSSGQSVGGGSIIAASSNVTTTVIHNGGGGHLSHSHHNSLGQVVISGGGGGGGTSPMKTGGNRQAGGGGAAISAVTAAAAMGAATPYHHHRAAGGGVSWAASPYAAQPAPGQHHGPTPPSHIRFNYTTYTTQPVSYGSQRVPTASSPANTNSSSSSNTGSQSGTLSTSLSNNLANIQQDQSQQLSKTNLYIRGLNQNTTDKDLVNMCSQYGTITSTKAILDKNTNKCRGYGFVDFESGVCAETAVKALVAKGVQAQMAKVGITLARGISCHISHSLASQQEQDPTNLYIANLPPTYKETDLDNLLAKYGQVISTRILRDTAGISKGVGFARMESKEKCEQIIQIFNGNPLHGSKEPLLVKFADGGQKKRSAYRNDSRIWREGSETGHVAYDPTGLTQNGVATQHMLPASLAAQYGRYAAAAAAQPMSGYPIPTAQWPLQYVMQPAPHMTTQVDMMAQATDPSSAVQYGSMIPQITTHMSALQLGTPGYIAASPHHAYPFYGPPSIIHTVPISENEHNSNTASPDDNYQAYQGQQQK